MNEPDQASPDRAMIANGCTAMVPKLPNPMTTISRSNDCAIADGGAARALAVKFTRPPGSPSAIPQMAADLHNYSRFPAFLQYRREANRRWSGCAR
jgi:hypothetical protein